MLSVHVWCCVPCLSVPVLVSDCPCACIVKHTLVAMFDAVPQCRVCCLCNITTYLPGWKLLEYKSCICMLCDLQ